MRPWTRHMRAVPILPTLLLSLLLLLPLFHPAAASAIQRQPLPTANGAAVPLAPITLTLDLPPPLHRGVNEVAPALTNATATALAKAQNLLTHYGNALRIVAIPTGLLISFFGYFLLAPVLFLAAFTSGGGLVFVAVSAVLGEDTPAAVWISIAAMLLGGAMLGFLALRALNLGMFAVGAALGVVVASAFKTTLLARAYPADPQLAFILAAVVLGALFGLLATCLQKQMLIFSTAYAGSCACMFGIGHFAGHFPTSEDISAVEQGDVNGWLLFYILVTLAIGTAGMFFQFWLSKNKPMPTHAPNDRRRRRTPVPQFDDDDWEASDDPWLDERYMERVPLPEHRRLPPGYPRNMYPHDMYPRDMYRREASPSPPQPAPSQHIPIVRLESLELAPEDLSLPQRSWNSIKSAINIFDPGSPANGSDVGEKIPEPKLGGTGATDDESSLEVDAVSGSNIEKAAAENLPQSIPLDTEAEPDLVKEPIRQTPATVFSDPENEEKERNAGTSVEGCS